MAEAVGSSIAEALLEKLGSIALEEIPAAWGFKDDLEKLKDTVNTINDLLYDAEKKQVVSRAVQGWLKRLKSVLYDADDHFDEFSTMLMRKELMTGSTDSKKMHGCFGKAHRPGVSKVIMGCNAILAS
ncbi:hypothetical protein Dimus_029979 [Dionaea muscipula]